MASRYDELMKTKNFLPFNMGYLTPKLVQKAKEELKETDEIRGAALEKLRILIQGEKNLKCPLEDEYLIQFLRARKFDVKKAFALLQNKYQVKKSYSELYDECDIDEAKKVAASGAAYCLPYRDEDGCVVFMLKLNKWNPDDFSICSGLRILTILILRVVDDPATQVTGVRILVDVRGFSIKQLRCVTPRYLQLLSKALRNCLPVRFKGIHIYNESLIFQYIWSVLKLFLTEKLRNRVSFHGDSQKSLHKSLPKEILTAEYGGDNAHLNAAEWCQIELEKFYEKFLRIIPLGYS